VAGFKNFKQVQENTILKILIEPVLKNYLHLFYKNIYVILLRISMINPTIPEAPDLSRSQRTIQGPVHLTREIEIATTNHALHILAAGVESVSRAQGHSVDVERLGRSQHIVARLTPHHFLPYEPVYEHVAPKGEVVASEIDAYIGEEVGRRFAMGEDPMEMLSEIGAVCDRLRAEPERLNRSKLLALADEVKSIVPACRVRLASLAQAIEAVENAPTMFRKDEIEGRLRSQLDVENPSHFDFISEFNRAFPALYVEDEEIQEFYLVHAELVAATPFRTPERLLRGLQRLISSTDIVAATASDTVLNAAYKVATITKPDGFVYKEWSAEASKEVLIGHLLKALSLDKFVVRKTRFELQGLTVEGRPIPVGLAGIYKDPGTTVDGTVWSRWTRVQREVAVQRFKMTPLSDDLQDRYDAAKDAVIRLGGLESLIEHLFIEILFNSGDTHTRQLVEGPDGEFYDVDLGRILTLPTYQKPGGKVCTTFRSFLLDHPLANEPIPESFKSRVCNWSWTSVKAQWKPYVSTSSFFDRKASQMQKLKRAVERTRASTTLRDEEKQIAIDSQLARFVQLQEACYSRLHPQVYQLLKKRFRIAQGYLKEEAPTLRGLWQLSYPNLAPFMEVLQRMIPNPGSQMIWRRGRVANPHILPRGHLIPEEHPRRLQPLPLLGGFSVAPPTPLDGDVRFVYGRDGHLYIHEEEEYIQSVRTNAAGILTFTEGRLTRIHDEGHDIAETQALLHKVKFSLEESDFLAVTYSNPILNESVSANNALSMVESRIDQIVRGEYRTLQSIIQDAEVKRCATEAELRTLREIRARLLRDSISLAKSRVF